jgi:hypothetical protein
MRGTRSLPARLVARVERAPRVAAMVCPYAGESPVRGWYNLVPGEAAVKKPLLILGLVAVGGLAVATWKMRGDGDVSVFDRIWIDQRPSKPKETGNAFVAITKQQMGAFQSASQYKASYEIFSYKASGDELRIVYPLTDEKEKITVRAWRCKEHDMDYCLELGGSTRGVKRYHSRRGWEIDESTRLEQVLSRVESIVRPTI